MHIHTYTSTKSDGDIKVLRTSKQAAKHLTEKLGVHFSDIHFPKMQVHEDTICEPGIFQPEYFDAAVTCRKNTVLVAIAADCLGILFYDQKNAVIGAAHCGRKGTAKKLAQKVVRSMLARGAEKEQIVCQFGPSISQKNYEVTAECAKGFHTESMFQKENGKVLLDIPLENKQQLLALGIPEKNIILSEIDTFEDESFFSYRRGDSERFANFIWMTDDYE